MTLADQTAVAVAIYNDDLALVRDSRRIQLAQGRNKLALVDVSGRLRAETALLAPLGGAQLRLLEQNLEFDLLTPQKLLEKSVGKEVTIVKTHPQTGEETRLRAVVLSTAQGVVLRTTSPQEFAKFLENEVSRWSKVVRESKITAQ